MPIDFFLGPTRKLSLPEPVFAQLLETQKTLRAKTGLFVDPYGTTTLSATHATLWAKAVREFVTRLPSGSPLRAPSDSLATLLESVGREGSTLLVQGE